MWVTLVDVFKQKVGRQRENSTWQVCPRGCALSSSWWCWRSGQFRSSGRSLPIQVAATKAQAEGAEVEDETEQVGTETQPDIESTRTYAAGMAHRSPTGAETEGPSNTGLHYKKKGRPRRPEGGLRSGGIESTMRFNEKNVESDYGPSNELHTTTESDEDERERTSMQFSIFNAEEDSLNPTFQIGMLF